MTEDNKVESVFKELYVKLQWGGGEEFTIPRGIENCYSLNYGDALHCELVGLKGLRKGLRHRGEGTQKDDLKKIGRDILVDVVRRIGDNLHGVIPSATFDLYEMKDYEYALLKIKKTIKRS